MRGALRNATRWAPICAAIAFTATTGAARPAFAAEPKDRIWISADIDLQQKGDFVLSRRSAKRSTNIYLEAYPEFTFHLTPRLLLHWEPEMKQTEEAGPGENFFFKNQAIYTNQLFLSYRFDLDGIGPAKLSFRPFGGKFTPAFGRYWDIGPGVYGDDFAVDSYEYDERIGFGGEIEVDGGVFGNQVFQASLFFLDTSSLSNSVITPRGHRRLSDGGVSNTGRLNSFILSWTSTDNPGIPGLELQLALSYQSAGKDGNAAELGVVGSVLYKRRFGAITVTPFVELVYYSNADGLDTQSRFMLAASVEVEWKNWTTSVLALVRNTHIDDASDQHDFLFSISAGYKLPFGLTANFAYVYSNEDRTSSHGVGFLLEYNCRFSIGSRRSSFSCKDD